MALIDDLINYYVDLLIIQYNNKPKARATIAALAAELLASAVYFDVENGYSIETAVGKQLDVLGKYADIDRFYRGQILEGFFSFITYEEVDDVPEGRIGFADYSDFETKSGEWLAYYKIISENLVLPDEDFRILLKLRIIQNNSDHSHKSIDDSIHRFFPGVLIPDSIGSMVMDYFVFENDLPIIDVARKKDVLPRPAGVRLRYFIEKEFPFFGFATYDNLSPAGVAGFADYDDFDSKEGETLRYSKLLEV